MLHKTKGIVLSFVKYRETSIIVKIFTEKFGLKSYVVNSVRTSKGKSSKIALFQPFTLLDLVVYNRKNSEINRLSEVRVNYPFLSIPYEITKSTICIFLTEVLLASLKEEEIELTELFDFLESSIKFLDSSENHFDNFHLQFLVKLTHFLGFSMQSAEETETQLSEHKLLFIPQEAKGFLNQLISADYENDIQISGHIRRDILDYILKFYALQIDNFGEMKSLAILREL